jgi:pilus assembly protein CpaB
MNRKFNPVIVVGAVLALAGIAVLAVLATKGDSTSKPRTIKALVATSDIAAGTPANTASMQVQDVSSSDVPNGSPTSAGALAGQIATVRITKGTVISSGAFGNVSTAVTSAGIALPKGKQALGIELGFAPGALRYVVPGNKITVWVTPKQKAKSDGTVPYSPGVALVQDVLVLRTTPGSGDGSGTSATAGPGNLDFLLAVDDTQASRLVGAASQPDVNTLYVTLSSTSQG